MKIKRIASFVLAAAMVGCTASVMSASAAKARSPYYIKVMKGDVTGNGRIDKDDLNAVLAHIKGQKALPNNRITTADVNWDGKVDIEDAAIIRQNVGVDDEKLSYKAGNVEGNNYITSDDVQAIMDHINGKHALDKYEMKRADINSDGKIDIEDANNLQFYISR